ncbi:tetratricopeptide repeat protein [Nostoc sp.]|uniref:tetratricopeptide repeat protein n=1 Tax=Nostoc sp. TaxID=1180 RepID=UPI003FA5FA65
MWDRSIVMCLNLITRNLGYYSQGRYSEAKPLCVQALDICERQLGVNHPNTVTVREGLAYLHNRFSSNQE